MTYLNAVQGINTWYEPRFTGNSQQNMQGMQGMQGVQGMNAPGELRVKYPVNHNLFVTENTLRDGGKGSTGSKDAKKGGANDGKIGFLSTVGSFVWGGTKAFVKGIVEHPLKSIGMFAGMVALAFVAPAVATAVGVGFLALSGISVCKEFSRYIGSKNDQETKDSLAGMGQHVMGAALMLFGIKVLNKVASQVNTAKNASSAIGESLNEAAIAAKTIEPGAVAQEALTAVGRNQKVNSALGNVIEGANVRIKASTEGLNTYTNQINAKISEVNNAMTQHQETIASSNGLFRWATRWFGKQKTARQELRNLKETAETLNKELSSEYSQSLGSKIENLGQRKAGSAERITNNQKEINAHQENLKTLNEAEQLLQAQQNTRVADYAVRSNGSLSKNVTRHIEELNGEIAGTKNQIAEITNQIDARSSENLGRFGKFWEGITGRNTAGIARLKAEAQKLDCIKNSQEAQLSSLKQSLKNELDSNITKSREIARTNAENIENAATNNLTKASKKLAEEAVAQDQTFTERLINADKTDASTPGIYDSMVNGINSGTNFVGNAFAKVRQEGWGVLKSVPKEIHAKVQNAPKALSNTKAYEIAKAQADNYAKANGLTRGEFVMNSMSPRVQLLNNLGKLDKVAEALRTVDGNVAKAAILPAFVIANQTTINDPDHPNAPLIGALPVVSDIDAIEEAEEMTQFARMKYGSDLFGNRYDANGVLVNENGKRIYNGGSRMNNYGFGNGGYGANGYSPYGRPYGMAGQGNMFGGLTASARYNSYYGT